MRPFLFRDPPDHTRLRGLVAKAFTPKMVESLRDRAQRMVDELLDDVWTTFGTPATSISSRRSPRPYLSGSSVISSASPSRTGRFREWSDAMARGLDPDFLLTNEIMAARDDAVVQFAAYFFELLADRRRSTSAEDLLSRLAR